MGQNFSWLEQVGHGLEQQGAGRQRARNLRNAVRRQCVKLNARACASRSKAKAKPQRRISASSSTKTIPIEERTWTDIEPQDYSPTDYSVSKKLINLLRHGSLPREDDGAIEFWRKNIIFRNILCILEVGRMKIGRASWQKEEETKYFSIVLILQEKLFTSELSKLIQDAT